MKVDDSGPAFPAIQLDKSGEMMQWASQEGMTLRQWFAGKALAGYLAYSPTLTNGDPEPEKAARVAVEYADALLAELKK